MNKVIVLANLTKDIELRYTPQGTAVANLRIAINRKYKSGEEYKDEVCFITAVAWGKTAENCSKYLAKGSQVLIEGHLQSRQWEKDGQKQYVIEIRADNVQFLNTKKKEETGQAEQTTEQQWLDEEPGESI